MDQFEGGTPSSTQTVTVNVADENDIPVLDVNAGVSVVEGSDVTISSAELSVSDEDEPSSQIVYSVVAPPTAGRLEFADNPGIATAVFTQADIDSGRLRFVHDGSEADDSFTFSVSDGSGGTIGTTLFSITNLRVNDAPINSAPTTQTATEDTPLVFSSANGNSISISDEDLNGGAIGVRLISTNGTMTLGTTSGLVFATGDGVNDSDIVFAGLIDDVNTALEGLTFAPTSDYNGPASVRIISRDMGSSGSGGEQIDDDTISISVNAVNDNPVAADDEYSTSEDIPLTITAASGLLSNDSDIDGDTLSAVTVAGPTNGNLALNADGSFTYTPNLNFNGTDSFTYRASDGGLQSEIRTVTLNVAAVNDPSVSNDDSYTIGQLTVLELDAADGVLINDTDVEADPLQAILINGPQNGQLILNADGSLTYTPNATFFGVDTFTYRSLDGTDPGSIATVRINVQQTVTSGGGDGDSGDGSTNGSGDGDSTGDGSTDQTGESGSGSGTTGDGTGGNGTGGDGTDGGSGDSALDNPLISPPTDSSTTDSDPDSDDDSGATTESDNGQNDGSHFHDSSIVVALRVDDRGELRDRLTGRIVEDAGVVVLSSTDVGSMVYVLEKTGFWTELDTFQQDVQNSIMEEGEWEELVVETTTVAGTTLTVGYIVWLLRSGSVVFGLVSSLPAWTMIDPLPVLQSGLENLDTTDNSDDDSLHSILQAHHNGLSESDTSFDGS